jgi:hypothetical protein
MTAVPGGHKYIEERRDIEMTDMYFLWKVQHHAS